MSWTQVIACDECGGAVPDQGIQMQIPQSRPVGMFGEEEQLARKPVDFCSWRCVIRFAIANREPVDLDAESDGRVLTAKQHAAI